jgi:hypothetical protein
VVGACQVRLFVDNLALRANYSFSFGSVLLSQYSLILLAGDQRLKFDALVDQLGTPFNKLAWLDLFGDRIAAYGIVDAEGALIGGLFLYWERRWGLKIIRRAPFTPNGGPFFKRLASNPVAQLEEQRKILSLVADLVEEERAAVCMLPLPQGLSDALPFFWRGYKVIPAMTYLIDLTQPQANLWRNMSGTRRNDIRKAQADGLTVTKTSDMRSVRDLVLATFDRQNKWVDRQILEAILFSFSKPENSYAFVAYRNHLPIAASFVVHDRSTAYYLLGGYSSEGAHHGAGAWALWESIQHAQSLGLRTFDFEGSVIPAIERYFRGFGGTATPYLTVNKGWFAVEIALKLIKRNTF